MLTVTEIVLQYVCPLFGCLLANFMYTAPVKDVREAVKRGTLGSLNPTPWAFMIGNNTGWVIYSYIIQNHFLFWADVPGLIASVWLNMAAAKLQYCDSVSASMRSSFVQLLDTNKKSFRLPRGVDVNAMGNDDIEEGGLTGKDKEQPQKAHTFADLRRMTGEIVAQKKSVPAAHEMVVVGVVTFWVAVVSLLAFLDLNLDQWQAVIGIVANINLAFFYGAPLSTIFTVLKTRDSSSIHRWTMLINTATACFWTAMGFGIMDWYIIVPNGIGSILGFIQIFLRLVVPSQDLLAESTDEKNKQERSSAASSEGNTDNDDVESTAVAVAATELVPTAEELTKNDD